MTRSFLALLMTLVWITLAACSGSDNNNVAAPVPAPPPAPTPAPPARTQSGATCGEVPLPQRKLLYCFQDIAGQAARNNAQINVIYYFHGLGGNVNDLFGENGRLILDGLSRLFGANMPIVASLSVGSNGVLGPDTGDVVNSGLPVVEGFMAPGKTFRRIVLGGSMGGHNTLRLGAESPASFAALAALCPALATFNGHDQAEVDAYIQRHADVIDVEFFNRALAIYKEQLPTPEIWDANNPFTFLDQGRYDGIPIFLSVGIEDQLGFIEGSREFKRRSDLRPRMSVDYHEVHGQHCSFDVNALLRFMAVQVVQP